jgi:GH24 family phage-related lysozyme (muramidase)
MPSSNSSSSNNDIQFQYWLDASPRFRLSREQRWRARLKIFNFNRLSDNNAATWHALTPQQMAGLVPFTYNFTLRSFDDRYWHGKRLYAELGWGTTSLARNAAAAATTAATDNQTLIRENPAGATPTLIRFFVDSPQYTRETTYVPATDTTALVGGLIGGAIGLLLLVFLVVRAYRRYRDKRDAAEFERLVQNRDPNAEVIETVNQQSRHFDER